MLTYIGPHEMSFFLSSNKVIIIDIRDRKDYMEGHIDGAINIPYNLFLKKMYCLNRNNIYLIYCHRGNMSLRVSLKLDMKGYNIVNLTGGYSEYVNYN